MQSIFRTNRKTQERCKCIISYKVYKLFKFTYTFFFQNDSLQRNLDDFEKVVKVQHSRSVETELLDKNLKDLKMKLVKTYSVKCVF